MKKWVAIILVFLWSTASAASVTLQWDKSIDHPYLSEYQVCIGVISGTYGTCKSAGLNLTYTFTDLSAGTYYFAAYSVDTHGLSGGYSNEVSALVVTDTLPPLPLPATGFTIAGAITITNEANFFAVYEKDTLITNLCWTGDGSCPDAWVVRGYRDGGFWNTVSVGTPYPIKIDPNGPSNYRLSLMEPTDKAGTFAAVPVAVYTDVGFKGIIPNNSSSKFFPLYAREITAIWSVTTK